MSASKRRPIVIASAGSLSATMRWRPSPSRNSRNGVAVQRGLTLLEFFWCLAAQRCGGLHGSVGPYAARRRRASRRALYTCSSAVIGAAYSWR